MAQHHADFQEGMVKVKCIPSAHECQSNWSLGSIYCCQAAKKQKQVVWVLALSEYWMKFPVQKIKQSEIPKTLYGIT